MRRVRPLTSLTSKPVMDTPIWAHLPSYKVNYLMITPGIRKVTSEVSCYSGLSETNTPDGRASADSESVPAQVIPETLIEEVVTS